MLSHISKATAIIIPITAECLMHAMFVIWFIWSGSEPHIIIEVSGHYLWAQIIFSHPEEFPIKTCKARYCNLKRPSQETGIDKFFQETHLSTKSIESICKTEPGVKSEDTTILFHGFHHFFTLSYCTCHRFFTEDVFSRISCINRHDTVPMRRCCNMNYVNISIFNKITIIVIRNDIFIKSFFSLISRRLKMICIDITNSCKTA